MASTYLGKPYYPAWLDNLADDVTGEVARGMAPPKAPRPSMKSWSPRANYTSFRSFTTLVPAEKTALLEDYTSAVGGGVPLLCHRAGHLQRRREGPLARGEPPSAQFLAPAVPADAREVHRHPACEPLGRHAVRSSSMNAPLYLVTGAGGGTGGVSRQVVEGLRGIGKRVRALVHHDDARAEPLREIGAEVVVGDLTEPRDVVDAMAGADRMFCFR